MLAGAVKSGFISRNKDGLANTSLSKILYRANERSRIFNGGIADELVLDDYVFSIVKLELRDSAHGLNFEEAGISSLQSFELDTLCITHASKIEALGRAALVLNEGADLEFINCVIVLAGAHPGCV